MSSGEEEEDASWIEWHCGQQGNEYMCEVDRSYIEDSFNLYGLRQQFSNYSDCLDIVLDHSVEESDIDGDQQTSAVQLYGLIHARYIVTTRGLEAMHVKYQQGDFGKCPRVLCHEQRVVPAGTNDELGVSELSVFCPKCEELYSIPPNPDGYPPIDGAFIGTTFPHLFFLAYPSLRPEISDEVYVPRVFGYRIRRYGRRRVVAIEEQENQETSSNSSKSRGNAKGTKSQAMMDDSRMKKRKLVL